MQNFPLFGSAIMHAIRDVVLVVCGNIFDGLIIRSAFIDKLGNTQDNIEDLIY